MAKEILWLLQLVKKNVQISLCYFGMLALWDPLPGDTVPQNPATGCEKPKPHGDTVYRCSGQ